MNGIPAKKIKSRPQNWISLINFVENRSKQKVRSPYCNLYHYAGNNPVHYIDPDGRDVHDKQTLDAINKINLIAETSNQKNIIPENIRTILSDRIVQSASILQKKSKHIADFIYIAESEKVKEEIIDDINENAKNPEMMILSKTWYDEDIHIDVREYSIYSYDKETKKISSEPLQVYVDIGDDGHIDYIQYIPFDWTKEQDKP